LEAEERRSQELLDKLAESEGRLAASQAENRNLTDTVQAQEALLEKQQALKFTDEELAELLKYSAIIIFDTCSIMNFPNLLDGVNDGELVVVPKDVNNELEHHKSRFGVDDRKIKAQKAITAIFNYKRRFPLTYAEAMLDLVPDVYRADEGDKEQNDNKILAVALRYKLYSHVPVIFITDDRSLSNKASGEGLEVWTAKDFLTPPETSFDDDEPVEEIAVVTDAPVAAETDQAEVAAAEAARKAKAQEEFLAQKISAKLLHLEASQISVLQNNGVKTVGDFMAQTEATFSTMKAKKSLSFTARFMKEQETIKRRLETL
jgi:rRNA maturation endonuclease Nob1